ncbi:MAG: ParB/RepB/Spo0J family partition protein [Firmicutes bacterium]|nr:ParB/RepB/Spo0J family partition protein [Bacillota bacterium]
MARQALGRGLKALINTDEYDNQEVQEIRISAIAPNPYQPRKDFDQEKLNELAQSIKEHGVIQPLVVKKVGEGNYVLVAGERRFRASQLAGLDTVPVIVKNLDENQMIQWALVENLQREDLNPIEEAVAYQRLSQEFGLTQEEIAKVVGKSRPAVANTMRLLTLPQEIQDAVSRGTLSMGHARCLIGLSSGAQRQLFQKIITEKLSVRQTEEACEKLKNSSKNKKQPRKQAKIAKDPYILAAEEDLRQRFGTKVHIECKKTGKGKIQIDFYSSEELNRLLDLLGTGTGEVR